MNEVLEVGIHNIPMWRYLTDPCPEPSLSSGVAHTLLSQSPRHAWAAHPALNPDYESEANEATDIGSLAHAIVLEGSEDGLCIIDAEDWRTKAAKEARDIARSEGKHPVLAKRVRDVRAMVSACKDFVASSELPNLFDSGQPEQTMIWKERNVWCRARPDWLDAENAILIHYKTTSGSAEPESWCRNQLYPSGYDTACVFYEFGYRALLEDGRQLLSLFLVQETKAPYGCSLIGLGPMARELAERRVAKAIILWDECLHGGKWPSYTGRVCYSDPPAWMEARQLEREMIDEMQMKEGLQV